MTQREELREYIWNLDEKMSKKTKKRLKLAGKIAAGTGLAVGAGLLAKKGVSKGISSSKAKKLVRQARINKDAKKTVEPLKKYLDNVLQKQKKMGKKYMKKVSDLAKKR